VTPHTTKKDPTETKIKEKNSPCQEEIPWISCDDELPPEDETVETMIQDEFEDCWRRLHLRQRGWAWHTGTCARPPTHWRRNDRRKYKDRRIPWPTKGIDRLPKYVDTGTPIFPGDKVYLLDDTSGPFGVDVLAVGFNCIWYHHLPSRSAIYIDRTGSWLSTPQAAVHAQAARSTI